MRIEVHEQPGAIVVSLGGEIDLDSSPRLRQRLTGLMTGGRTVVVDMSGVEYIDSSGIASLVEAYQRARGVGDRYVLAAVSRAAARVLGLARLDKVFELADSIEAAVARG